MPEARTILLAGTLLSNLWWIILGVLAVIFVVAYVASLIRKGKKDVVVDTGGFEEMLVVLGGIDNIVEVELEGTRIKVKVKELKKCEYAALKEHGASGVFVSGKTLKFLYPGHAKELYEHLQARRKEKQQ